MRKPLIGITAGEIANKYGKWAPFTHGQSHTYSDAIIHAGGIPMILPISEDETIWRSFYEACDGILFAGGNDIDPARYGHKKGSKTIHISKRRDAQELALMHFAIEEGKSMLAICRGMQLLNVACGGTLHQHLPTDFVNSQNHEASTNEKDTTHLEHVLRVDPTSKLGQVLAVDQVAANSHHHQGIATLGTGLLATAWSEDGLVEGIELESEQFAIGVQPHPESLVVAGEKIWTRLFASFVTACRQ